jgi:succinoglycan biosynthesis protein ExoO
MEFSVIIPAYNVSGIIERAIQSAAAQTSPPLEILVIDDCSTDNTAEVVKALAQKIPSLRLLSTPANNGPSAARNVGLHAARGNWIALLDSDDAWKPGRLDRLSTVARDTDADFVADNLVVWDAKADTLVSQSYYDLPDRHKQITPLDLFRADDNFNFKKKTFSLLKPIMKRQFLFDHRIGYNERMKIGEDFALYAEMLLTGAKAILIKDAHYIYSAPNAPSGRSPHSRSRYTFAGLSEMSRDLELRYSDRIDPQLRSAMRAYRQTMTRLHESDIARDHKRKGHYARYIGYLAARPGLVTRLAARALTA